MTTIFPVSWEDPSDASHTWTFERMHAPEPMTLADAVAFQCAFDHGVTTAARAYGVPLRAMTRRINTYLYLALVPTQQPIADRANDALQDAIGRLRELWEDTYLPEIERHLQTWEGFDPAAASLPRLIEALDESVQRTRRLYELHFLIWFPFMAAISLFDDLYADTFGRDSEFDAYRLLQGFDNKTLQSGRALWKLSRTALETDAVRVIFQRQPAGNVLSTLQLEPEGRGFLKLLREYLDNWGQRGERWGWSFASWIEDPTPVIKNLKDYVLQPDRDLEAELRARATEREHLVARTREQLRTHPPHVVERFEFLLTAAQAAIVLTEDHSHWIDFRCMYHLHRISLEAGRRLAAASAIDEPDDVFLLTLDELRETALDLPRLNRRAQVAARHAEIEYFRGVPVPATLGAAASGDPPGDPVNVALFKFFGAAPTPSNDATIRGSSGSPGKARGTARVVLSLAAAANVQPGDILVAKTTAPPWTPLFATAAGVVTDTGGILSHCAVVAREYGIPAVVGTGDATLRIHDGQRVEVDGDAGVVRLLGD